MSLHSTDDLREAIRIYTKLQTEGVVRPDDKDLLRSFHTSGVREILEIYEEENDIHIYTVDNAIYLTPGVQNRFFGYSNEEIRNKLSVTNNLDMYLAQFSAFVLYAKFYNSDDRSLATREFLNVFEWEQSVTKYMDEVLEMDEVSNESLEQEYDMEWRLMAERWKTWTPYNDTLVRQLQGKENRVSFLLRIANWLESEGLALLFDQRDVKLTEKMDRLMTRYYFQTERKERLIKLILQTIQKENPNAETAAITVRKHHESIES